MVGGLPPSHQGFRELGMHILKSLTPLHLGIHFSPDIITSLSRLKEHSSRGATERLTSVAAQQPKGTLVAADPVEVLQRVRLHVLVYVIVQHLGHSHIRFTPI